MMKKGLMSLFLIMAVSLTFVGCSGKEESAGEQTSETQSVESEETSESQSTESEQTPAAQNITWKITQYGPVDDNLSYYTIYSKDVGLIVIDGGWTDCADHVGAFNEIYPNPDGITIGDIYTVDMASPEECMEVASWDSMDAYNDFLALEVPDLQYVKAGDVLDVCGLEFEILSTFDEDVRNISGDYLNDGSVMFKVCGEEESFLFCADVGVGMSDHLLSKYGEEKLASTYLQMGHHGNGGLSDAFYQAVQPKVAFFDAPDWLLKDETGKYDTPENVKLMEGMGSRIYSFNSAPNSVYLE